MRPSALRAARVCVVALAGVAFACSLGATAQAASSDRAIKACLLARRDPAPQLVIYGSSRAAKLEPAYLGSLLHETAFNASVSSGTPEDVWAFVHLARDQAGQAPVRALWLLDVESLRPHPFDASLLQAPVLARAFSQTGGVVGPAPETAHGPAPKTCSFTTSVSARYAADGFRAHDFHDAASANGMTLARGLKLTLAEYGRIYRTGFPRVASDEVAWVARTIAALNAWGVRPVIVLTPLQPSFERTLGQLGWNQRHAEVLRALRSLGGRFTLLDASNIGVFGGSASDFYDGVHMRVANTRRLAAWIAQSARGDLTGP